MGTETILSKYPGSSLRLFYNAIQLIEHMSPCVVLIDEIDKLLGRRSSAATDGASDETSKVYNLFVERQLFKDCKSFMVGTTRRPRDLDDAAIRFGRLDYIIPIPYPDTEG